MTNDVPMIVLSFESFYSGLCKGNSKTFIHTFIRSHHLLCGGHAVIFLSTDLMTTKVLRLPIAVRSLSKLPNAGI